MPLTRATIAQFLDTASRNELAAAFLGALEHRTDSTTSIGPDLVEAYDTGRELAHQLTASGWDW